MIENIFDTHAHYDDVRFNEDRDELIRSLPNKGVSGVINIGCTLPRSQKSVDLANKYDFFYAAVGIHPSDVEGLPADYINRIKTMAQNEKVIAIGEIGLDYYYDGYDKELQIKIFKEQLELAREINLPVVIHSREATGDMMEILREYRPKGVMHCYSGSAQTAREIIKLGMYISFTGVITFNNARRAVESCEVIPMDRLLLETDAPYMAPTPFRGQRCDSSMIVEIAKKVGEIKGIPAQEVADICAENAKLLFGID
ncbi:MAG: TatD family hydrolase [Clostridiales bacterium]|nr:TatD family hydrolase [Clostridiales bacterium]